MFLKGKPRTFVLYFATVGLASGATLVCEKADSDGKLSCNLKVDYDEIAGAFGLNCVQAEQGLSCNFEVKNGEKITRMVSPESSKIEECAEDGVCIDTIVSTVLQQKRDTQSTSHLDNATGKPDDKQQPRQGVVIGDYEYKEPFEQYAEPIARTLRARAGLWKTPPNDIGTEYAFANAHLDLGISHFSAVTTEDHSPGTYGDSLQDSFDLKLAVNAFKVAEKMYFSILETYDNEKSTIFKSLASLYLQWGEVYQNSNYFDDEVGDDESAEFNKLALGRYQQAERYYRLSLENLSDGQTTDYIRKDTNINLAHVSHRIGRCLVNSMEGASVVTVLREEVAATDPAAIKDALRGALPQLETLLHTVPTAEKHFAEAIRLYRIAIEHESDFAAQTRLKLNLATTLQDAGTAAAYTSNIRKAIELQEEGVDVSKEILPHVGASEKQFLLQYVADSMYGLANQYMQVGEYEKTKSTYKTALDWYEKYNLGPPLVADYAVDDAALEAYEKQLADYYELVREITMPDGYSDGSQPMYAPNDAYEADLHAALGSLHLSRDQVLMSIEHFNEAIRLYEKGADETGENLTRSIADVKVSLATAYFRNGDFANSIDAHGEAMDIYKVEVGEGKNPMLASLAAQLRDTIDLDAMMAGTVDLDELLGSAEFQAMRDSLDVLGRDLTDKLDKRSNAGKGNDEVKKSKNDEQGNKAQQGEKNVHEQLIDADTIERVRQSIIINATATARKGEL